MKIPEGMTEAQVIEIVDGAIARLANSFKFGCYSVEDIKQECWVEALKLLAKGQYDGQRPLQNYVYRHIKNRLLNLKRNKLHRATPACLSCHDGQPCTQGPDGPVFCKRHAQWLRSNQVKSSLMHPQPLPEMSEDPGVLNALATSELVKLIDAELPAQLRSAWLRLKAGVPIKRHRRKLLEEAVRDIIAQARQTLES